MAGRRKKVKDGGKDGSSREGEVWYNTESNTAVGIDVVSMCHHRTWTVTNYSRHTRYIVRLKIKAKAITRPTPTASAAAIGSE